MCEIVETKSEEMKMKKILDDIRRDAILKLKLSEDKDQNLLIHAALNLLTLSTIARREGLLALEKIIESTESEFLKLIATLIIDGTEPNLVIEIAANEYWTNEPEGVQAMIAYFNLRGMIAIQSGENNQILKELLQSLIPFHWRTTYKKQLEETKESSKNSYQKEISEKFTNIHPIFQEKNTLETIPLLEKQIDELSNPSIQRIIRDIENYDLSICVYALSEDARKKILNNLSTRLANVIMEDVIHYHSISEKEVSNSIFKVLSVIEKLYETGEICIPAKLEKTDN